MKKYRIPWKSLLVSAGVFNMGAVLAQVVTVPAGCTVVVPGVGGGGATVGNGGIVLMPDPFAGGNFTFAGGTVISWSLLGDISEQTANVPPIAPDQSAGAVATVNIESYNKVVRTAETAGCSNSSLARSKGRVTIVWDDGICDNIISFDILKTWSSCPPAIVGPSCWGTPPFVFPNNLMTFSVDQLISDNPLDAIGFDLYYWKITNGPGTLLPTGAFYTSADRSSITIDQGTAAFATWLGAGGPYTLLVCYGRGIPWDGGTNLVRAIPGTTCVVKVINPAAVAPTFTTPIPTCVNTNVFSFSAAYTPQTGCAYSWTSTNGSWTLAPGAGTLAVSTMGANPGTLNLTANCPCGTNVYTYPVGRRFVGIALTTSSTCLLPGPPGYTISLPANAQLNPTTWTAPAGWGFTNGNAAASIRTYTAPLGTPAGCYTISASSTACPGNISIVVAVKPATPVFVTPVVCVTQGSVAPIIYTVNPVGGAVSYTWTKPAGWGGPTSTVVPTATFTPNGTNVGTITVVANGCAAPVCPSNPASVVINFNAVTPAVNNPCVNAGVPGSTTWSVLSPQAGCTYTWFFPAGLGTYPAGAATSKTVTTLGNVGSFPGTVTANCPCGTAVTPIPVNVAYSIGLTLTNVPATAGPPPTAAYSTLSATPGCTSYSLINCNSGLVVQGPQAVGVFSLNNAGVAGLYTISATCGGCISQPPCVATPNSSLMPLVDDHSGTIAEQMSKRLNGEETNGVLISPNPNTGTFVLTVRKVFVAGTATLYDAKGQAVGTAVRLVAGANTLGNEGLAPGVYSVQIDLDGTIENRLMVVGQK